MKKISVLFISIITAALLSAGASAAVLFSQTASLGSKTAWASNGTRLFYLTNNNSEGTAGVLYISWTVANYVSPNGGIPATEDFYVELPITPIQTATYNRAFVTFNIVRLVGMGDKMPSETSAVVYISCDNGVSWSADGVKITVTPTGKAMSCVVGSATYLGNIYSCVSDDITCLAEDGKPITNIRLYPFGKGYLTRGGSFRMLSAQVDGYTANGLYSSIASMENKTAWASNGTRLFYLENNTVGGNQSVPYITWTIVDASGAAGGIPAGENFYIQLPAQSIDTGVYKDVYLEFDHVTLADMADKMLSEAQARVIVSCDGGASYSADSAELTLYATGKTMSSKVGETFYQGVVFRCVSDDLASLVPDGKTITNIRIYPFGNVNAVRGGSFRLMSVKIKGCAEEAGAKPTGHLIGVDVNGLRAAAVAEMKAEASIAWTPSVTLETKNFDGVGVLRYEAGTTYRGFPYTQSNYYATLTMFRSYLNESGVYTGPTAYVGGFPGTHCSSSVDVAWSAISTMRYGLTADMMECAPSNGLVPLGNLKWVYNTVEGRDVRSANSQQAVYEAYALLKPGDAVMCSSSAGGHVRMVTGTVYVKRNGDGTINGSASYITTTENGGDIVNYSSWKVDKQYTFTNLYTGGNFYIPFTFAGLSEGRIDKPQAEIIGKNTATDIKNGLHGVVSSNYRIDSMKIELTKADGTPVYSKTYVENTTDYLSLYYLDSALNNTVKSLMNGIYRCTVTVFGGPKLTAVADYKSNTLLDLYFRKNVPVPTPELGDMTGDSRINVLDLIAAAAVSQDVETPYSGRLIYADFDGNDSVSIADLVSLRNKIVG